MCRIAYFLVTIGVLSLFCAQPAVARLYEVGPEREFSSPIEVPWEALTAGDVVEIHWREEPYPAKWTIGAQGEPGAWVTIRGVPNPANAAQLPVIEGSGAQSAANAAPRSVVHISSTQTGVVPQFVRVENLQIRGAHPDNVYFGSSGGEVAYPDFSAALSVSLGHEIVISGCILEGSSNGLVVSKGAGKVTLEHSTVRGNGITGNIHVHNAYTENAEMIFWRNRMLPLREGAGGNNIKDRAGATWIVGNYIRGGTRCLDLVDSDTHGTAGEAWVVGNLIIREPSSNNQVVHYGGDSGVLEQYRTAPLHFFHNTLVMRQPGNVVLFRLSTENLAVNFGNNLVTTDHGVEARLTLVATSGQVTMGRNYLPANWRTGGDETVVRIDPVPGHDLMTGPAIGCFDPPSNVFALEPQSPVLGAAMPDFPVTFPEALLQRLSDEGQALLWPDLGVRYPLLP